MNSIHMAYKRIVSASAGQMFFVLGLFMVLRPFCLQVFYQGFLSTFYSISFKFFGDMPPAFWVSVPYHSGSILFAALVNPFFFTALLLLFLPFFIKRKTIASPSFKFTLTERLLIFVPAFLLAWELSSYDFNYFLGHAFYLDRVVLLLLALILFRFPLLTPLFIAFAYVYRSQFNYPVDGFPLYDKRLLFDVLVMFTVHVYARLFIPAYKVPFLFFVLCILAAEYFISGLTKITLSPHGYEWLLYNEPSSLFYNVLLRGWMGHTEQSTISALGNFFTHYGKFFQAFVFIIELSAIFILRSRKKAILILTCLIAMHGAIFFLAGILFWKWMLLDLVLLFIFAYKKGYFAQGLFQADYFKASLIVIPLAVFWLQPVKFTWHDTPANQFFTYEVVDAQGKTYALEKNQMNPYHQWFQMDRFLFLVDNPCLPLSGFGYTTDFKIAKAIKSAGPGGFLTLEEQMGTNTFQPGLKKKYEDFILTYFKARNKLANRFFLPSLFMAPHHLYNYSAANVWPANTPVKLFRVIFNQVYTFNGKPIWLNKQVVDEVAIPY